MTNDAQRKIRITRYLLGQVSQEERDEIENGYLREDNLFEELVAIENDMIDNYVRGELTEPEKGQFEAYFLSTPERRERVHFARSLAHSFAASPSLGPNAGASRGVWRIMQAFRKDRTSAIRLAIATGLVAAVSVSIWMAAVNRTLRHQLEAARTGEAKMQKRTLELGQRVADLQQVVSAGNERPIDDLPAPGSATLSLTLVPDLVRGGGKGQNSLSLSTGISKVVLLLPRDHEESLIYSVVLETAEGKRVWQNENIEGLMARNGSKIISVKVSSNVLNRGDYVLRLFRNASGGTGYEVDAYSFRVMKP
jgi:hypothetical protein